MTKEEIIKNLKYTMEKHKNDTVSTFSTNISVMCKDILDYLEQEPKTGHWIEGRYKDTCSHCRCTYPKDIGFKNYCPNCGARMIDQKESEDKEYADCIDAFKEYALGRK